MTPPKLTVVKDGSAQKRLGLKRRPIDYSDSHDDGEGNWLVSYADMMTLLFGFFVMIAAFSTPEASKLESLKQKTSESMGGKYTKPYEQLSGAISKMLQEIQLEKEVSIVETSEGVTLTSKGTLFFDSGSARLKPQAELLVEKISGILADQAKGFRIVVEGHTDDSPIKTKDFPSNWELSSVRAGVVIRKLESKGFLRTALRPIGLADTEPLAPNHDAQGNSLPENQAQNRRLVIKIQKQIVTQKP